MPAGFARLPGGLAVLVRAGLAQITTRSGDRSLFF